VATVAAVAAKPVVDRLKVAMTPPAQQITVGWISARSSGGQISPMYETPVGTDPLTRAFYPMLATEWELSKDAMTFRVKLRKDVVFHTGKPFTAKDVVFTWERQTGQDSIHSSVDAWRKLVKSKTDFEIINDHEIVYHLGVPGILAPYYSSFPQGFFIYSKDQWDATGGTTKGYAEKPTGTGPYRFVEFKEGQHILFEAQNQHWRKVPEFKELQIFYVPEASTRLAQLVAGEVHVSEIDRALKPEVLKRGMKVVPATIPGISTQIAFGGNYLPDKRVEGPLSNKLVRQALNLAFDRQAVQKTIFGGDGELMVLPGVQGQDEAYNREWKLYPYDPQKAKELLVQAGYPNGFNLELWTARYPGAPELPEVAEAAATMWNAIGVKTKIVDSEFGPIRDRYRGRSWTGSQAYTFRGSADPSFRLIDSYYTSPGVGAPVLHFYEDPFVDERWKKFLNTVEPAERTKLLKEMANFMYDATPTVPLLWLSGLAGINPAVVAEYQCDFEIMGPTRCHEYTKAVRR
jgi:dipeptide transport system substrate-binding protein